MTHFSGSSFLLVYVLLHPCAAWYGLNFVSSKIHRLKPEFPVPHTVTLFGDRTFNEVIKIEIGSYDGPASNVAAILVRRENSDTQKDPRGVCAHRETIMCGYSRKVAICKPRRRPQEKPYLMPP